MMAPPRAEEIATARQAWRDASGLPVGIRVGVAASMTAEPLLPFAAWHLERALSLRAGLALAPFNQLRQACVDPDAAFGGQVDAALFIWRIEDVAPAALADWLTGRDAAGERLHREIEDLARYLGQLRRQRGLEVIAALPPAVMMAEASLDSNEDSLRLSRLHRSVTDIFLEKSLRTGLVPLDLAALMTAHGTEQAFQPRNWYLYRQPWTEAFWWRVGEAAARLVAATRVPRKKCIVLDCDNTLWGGIVGEDGIAGIELGEDFPGRAFADFQRQLRRLSSAGVFLAIASKNNPEDVWRVFDEHDGMVLRRDDVAAAEIGWRPKSEGISRIAARLNIGLDSVVFIDDSPMEVAEVSAALPEVTCLRTPEEPVDIPQLLRTTRAFDQLGTTPEDRQRVRLFAAESRREELRAELDPREFQKSLGLVLRASRGRPAQIARIAQLINKTNQFNLTTRRRTEAQVLELLESPAHRVYAVDVSDRFGEYGLVGVVIAELSARSFDIDTLLLSCRVLGRGVEQALMSFLAEEARREGLERVTATFLPTAKNAVASSYLPGMGFRRASETGFEAEARSIPPLNTWITLEAGLPV